MFREFWLIGNEWHSCLRCCFFSLPHIWELWLKAANCVTFFKLYTCNCMYHYPTHTNTVLHYKHDNFSVRNWCVPEIIRMLNKKRKKMAIRHFVVLSLVNTEFAVNIWIWNLTELFSHIFNCHFEVICYYLLLYRIIFPLLTVYDVNRQEKSM